MAEIVKKERDEPDLLKSLQLDGELLQPEGGERPCPACGKGSLAYDHFLNLVCDQCGYVEASCFT
jgi:ribosomal protein S27AE